MQLLPDDFSWLHFATGSCDSYSMSTLQTSWLPPASSLPLSEDEGMDCILSLQLFALLCALPYAHWGGYHGCGTQSWTGRAGACLSALRMVLGQNLLLYKLLLWLCHRWMKFWETKPLFTGVAVALWSPMIAVRVGRWLGGLRREGSFAVSCCKHCSKYCSCREAQ